MQVIKRDGTVEEFNSNKIISAVEKSAKRINIIFSEKDRRLILEIVAKSIGDIDKITVNELHGYVERALDIVSPEVAKSYKDYRNYKTEIEYLLIKDIKHQINKTMTEVDRSNANSNTRYISTQRTEIAGIVNKELYQEMYLSVEQRQAMKDGYIYVHDLKDRLLKQANCTLVDLKNILTGGFNLEGYHYTEPKDVKVAIGQISDITMIESAQRYGGTTLPELDKVISPYYQMSIVNYCKMLEDLLGYFSINIYNKAKAMAYRDMKQALQGMEIKLNTVVSARGSYTFSTVTFGDVSNDFEADVCRAILEVRMEGHGDVGFKKKCVFPKLVFIHNHDIHDKDKEYSWLFDLAVKCSSENLYPDYIGDGQRINGKIVSPMGCRSFLSDYIDPETNKSVFVGRGNVGVISLNIPMIYMKSKEECKPFFEVLDYYLEMVRDIHKFTYGYLGKAKASSNPLMFMEGGAYGGHLKEDDCIAPLLKSWTASFGITALHELTELALGKSIAEDNSFALKTVQHIQDKIDEFKEEDGYLYSMYGTPAESYAGTQLCQFRNKYGVIKNVSDRKYFTNSFHCHVSEDITPVEKQNKEEELFRMINGGHIQYVRISNPDNLEGLRDIIERGLDKGFYQGVNFDSCSCNKCGAHGKDWKDNCPNCGSDDINVISRVCGYLSFTKRSGDTTMNDAKICEINDRKSM